MDRFCRGAGHTFIHPRTATSRHCAYCGTHRWPWSVQDPVQMTRRDPMEENALLAATHHNVISPEAPLAMPLDVEAGEDSAGAAAGPGAPAGEAVGDDAIDAWLRFRPSATSGE
ncbi:MAG: hypothetical protein ACQEXN_05205 [Actinomycetota bacterium]